MNNWECIIYLKNIYLTRCLFSGCFINFYKFIIEEIKSKYIIIKIYFFNLNNKDNENKNIYIVTSNCANSSDLIKIYNLQGEIVKEISDSYEETYFIDVYYE